MPAALPLAVALASSLCWGLADFLGGMQSRAVAALAVTVVSQAAGLAGVAVLAVVVGGPPGDLDDLLPAALGGMAGALGLVAFYTGLAVGRMSIVAPISATGAVVPVAVGVALGELPGPVVAGGILLALVGVVLASREADHAEGDGRGAGRRAVLLALIAALGFGSFFVGIDAAAEASVLWALVAARTASVTLLLAICAATRRSPLVPAGRLAPVVLVGALDVSANGLYAWATTEGLLAVVSVLGSLYPVVTVLLARAVLGERVRRIQEAGIVAALAGVVLIAAG